MKIKLTFLEFNGLNIFIIAEKDILNIIDPQITTRITYSLSEKEIKEHPNYIKNYLNKH